VRAICGVGLLESFWNNNVSGINKKILYKTLFGWIATCIFVGILTAQGIYSPIL
jgi:phosphate/sulfate permease